MNVGTRQHDHVATEKNKTKQSLTSQLCLLQYLGFQADHLNVISPRITIVPLASKILSVPPLGLLLVEYEPSAGILAPALVAV